MRVNPFLNFGGNCSEAMNFYQEHLGGKLCGMMKFGDAPDQSMIPPGSKDLVMWRR